MKKEVLVFVVLLLLVGCTEKTVYPDVPESEEVVGYSVEVFAQNLFVPWSIVFSSPDRMLITQRNGSLISLEDGKKTTLYTFEEVSSQAEEGLMGLALHPNYDENKLFYVSYAYVRSNGMFVKVVQLEDLGDSAAVKKAVLDNIPAARFHAGSRLRFGPDDKLYVTTGDATDKDLAQDLDNLAGKILRLDPDGSIPSNNPFPDSYVYSYGHRNPQGIGWHPSGEMWQTEHGPSVFDGPPGGDEVNLIQAGKNYGWPIVSHTDNKPGLEAPKLVFTPAEPPGSGMFYKSNILPQFQNNFFYGSLKGRGIIRVVVSEDGKDVEFFEKLFENEYGRIREIVQGPDGYIYFASSNRDGRGSVREGDDTIYRIIPKT